MWLLLLFLVGTKSVFSQSLTYSDGPIELKVRVRKILVTAPVQDWAFLGAGFQPDEHTFKIWVRDNADIDGVGWVGGTCLQYNGDPPYVTTDFNTIIFNYTYPSAIVPAYFDIRLDAWQDNCGSDAGCDSNRCDFNNWCCCGVIFLGMCVGVQTNDKIRCNADPYKVGINYRLGPPCRWYNHGFIIGGTCSNDYYNPEIESYWRYTRGEDCNTPIILGTLQPGTGNQLLHFNSNECYNNDFGTPGKDVFYQVFFPEPIGVKISLCGNTNFNTVLYLLDSNCSILTSNDDYCANKSEIVYSICYPGKYYIVVDGAGASDMGTFELIIKEETSLTFKLSIDSGNVSCWGGSDGYLAAVVYGGFPPYQFQWSNGSTDSVITGLSAGTYWVNVIDNTGCILSDTVVITQPNPLQVTINTTPSTCGGTNNGMAEALVWGGTPPYNYLWQVSPAQIGQTAINLAPGNYNVIITDNNGCIYQTTFSIGATLSIQPQIDSIKNASCYGYSDGYVGISISGGNPPYIFQWDNGSGGCCLNNISAGVYTVSITDNVGCTATYQVSIGEPPPLMDSLVQIVKPTCWGSSSGAIDIYTWGGTPPYSYTWSSGHTTEDLFNIPAGIYNLTIKDANGCSITETYQVDEPPQMTINSTVNDVRCWGSYDGSIQVVVSGGIPPYSYSWNNGSTQSVLTSLNGGLYFLTVTDSAGCQKEAFFVVNEPDSITLKLVSVISPVCHGDSSGTIDIQTWGGTPPYSYTWSNGATTEDLIDITAGSYSLTLTDANGCTKYIVVEVNDPPPIVVNGIKQDVTCGGDNNGSIIVNVNGGYPPYHYQWSNGETTPSITGLSGGIYLLIVSDSRGCISYWVGYISEPAPLSLEVYTGDARCPNSNDGYAVAVVSGGTPPYTYSWSAYGSNSPQIGNLPPGDYSVTISDFNMCSIEKDFSIAEPMEPPDNCNILPAHVIMPPNAFSPNGDGVNDMFVIYMRGVSHANLLIFDRWGNKIYQQETDGTPLYWDGTYNSKPVPEGTYVYLIIATYDDGTEVKNIGRLHLIR